MEDYKGKFSLIKLPVEDDPTINKIESVFNAMKNNCQDELYMGLLLRGMVMHIEEAYDCHYEEVWNCLKSLKEAEFWWDQ